MVRGRSKTFKYKYYEYDKQTKELLSVELTNKDEEELRNIYDNYHSLGVNRGYEYIIKDLYILTEKRNISTFDIANIYDVGVRSVQIWLKELGLNRDRKEAQKIAVAKRDYKEIKRTFKNTMLTRYSETQLTGSNIENYIRYKLNSILIEVLPEYEIITGINTLGIMNLEADIPIIIIKDNYIYKFIVEVDGFYSHNDENSHNRHNKKNQIAASKGYKVIHLSPKAYFKDDKLVYKNELDTDIINISQQILSNL